MSKKLIFLLLVIIIVIGFLVFKKSSDVIISLDTDNVMMYVGENKLIIASINSNDSIKWESSNPSVVMVNDNGIISAIGMGDAYITVSTIDNKAKKDCHVTVLAHEIDNITLSSEITMTIGEKKSLDVTIEPSDATYKDLKYQSSNVKIVTVDNNGIIYGKSSGKAVITVKSMNGISASCNVTVVSKKIPLSSIKLSQSSIKLTVGKKEKLEVSFTPTDASNKSITWTSSNPSVATVDSSGTITGLSKGTAKITASGENGIKASCNVTVESKKILLNSIKLNKSNIKLTVGKKEKLEVTFSPTDASNKNIKWTSSNASVATVDSSGTITGLSKGIAKITVTGEDGINASCNVTVESAQVPVTSLRLIQTNSTLDVGKKITLKVSISPSNATNKKLTWSSNDSSIASVDANGIVTAKKSGKAIIMVKSSNNKMAVCYVTVNREIKKPIVPSNVSIKYESSTFRYYIQKHYGYYLTYIWMNDPYNQIRKLDSTTAKYGKIMSDAELHKNGYGPLRMSVDEMVKGYISNGMINPSKAVLAYNGSGFFDNRAASWTPSIPYYNLRSTGWFSMNNGKIIRNRDELPIRHSIVGINENGDLVVYGMGDSSSARKNIVNRIRADKVKNTWSFAPQLVKNGVASSWMEVADYRNALCQINSNNYVMYTSTAPGGTYRNIASLFERIGCKTAFNFDGGGSTTFFIKNAGSRTLNKMQCSDGSSRTLCRATVEGIYFTEK